MYRYLENLSASRAIILLVLKTAIFVGLLTTIVKIAVSI